MLIDHLLHWPQSRSAKFWAIPRLQSPCMPILLEYLIMFCCWCHFLFYFQMKNWGGCQWNTSNRVHQICRDFSIWARTLLAVLMYSFFRTLCFILPNWSRQPIPKSTSCYLIAYFSCIHLTSKRAIWYICNPFCHLHANRETHSEITSYQNKKAMD